MLNEVAHIKQLLAEKSNSTLQALKLDYILMQKALTALANLPRRVPSNPDDKEKDEGPEELNFSELLSDYNRMWHEDQTEGKIDFRAYWDEVFKGLREEDQTRISHQQLTEAEMIEERLSVFDNEDAEDIAKQFIMDPARGIQSDSEEVALWLHDLLVGGALNSCLEAQIVQNAVDYDSD
jgi:hypothetical protein